MILPVLVLGYGNTLRGDDAAGPEAAATLARLAHPGLDARPCHQLTPELAEPIAGSQLTLFIDASTHPHTSPTCTPLKPGHPKTGSLTHSCSPESLLALALALYGHAPTAWLIQIPATSFNLGEPLTPTCTTALNQAVHLATQLAAPFLNHHTKLAPHPNP